MFMTILYMFRKSIYDFTCTQNILIYICYKNIKLNMYYNFMFKLEDYNIFTFKN